MLHFDSLKGIAFVIYHFNITNSAGLRVCCRMGFQRFQMLTFKPAGFIQENCIYRI